MGVMLGCDRRGSKAVVNVILIGPLSPPPMGRVL
jgi:hypothetical protein